MEAADVFAAGLHRRRRRRRCQISFHDSSGSVFTGGSEVGGQKIRFMSWELDAESRC